MQQLKPQKWAKRRRKSKIRLTVWVFLGSPRVDLGSTGPKIYGIIRYIVGPVDYVRMS